MSLQKFTILAIAKDKCRNLGKYLNFKFKFSLVAIVVEIYFVERARGLLHL